MKKCPYCQTENRDETIFCTHCRHALPAEPALPRSVFLWVLVAFVLIGLTSTFFSFRSSPLQTPTALFNGLTAAGPTRTPEPVTLSACVRDSTNIRRGPGTQYETIGGLVSGTCLTILGRNEEGSWVSMVSDDHQTGWVSADVVRVAGDITMVSVRDDGAMKNSAQPTLTSAEIAHGAKAYLTEIAATNLPQSPLSRYKVPCFETAHQIGSQISCRLERAHCDYFSALEGSPTFCSDRPHPDHTFTLVLFGEDWSGYDGQCLLVSGYLELDRGVLRIRVFEPSQVSKCD